jgi:peptidoglycan/xylan/chitin deacetylase (PgdA/CDA1 family)
MDRFSWVRPDNVVQILFAHRVVDISSLGSVGEFFRGIPAQVLDTGEFVRRLQHLQKSYRFVSLDEALEDGDHIRTDRVAVLTFDDVYADFAQVIQPLLQELGIPALFYVITSGLEQKELLWYDKVYSAAIGTDLLSVTIEGLGGIEFSFRDVKSKRQSAVDICGLLWLIEPTERDEVIAELVDKIGPGPLTPDDLYLSTETLIELARNHNVIIGSHTVTHPNLLKLSDREVESELSDSKATLESLVGYAIKHLSYPNGLADKRIKEIARQCGYESACMTGKGGMTDRYGLRRVNIGWGHFPEFSVRMSGLIPW